MLRLVLKVLALALLAWAGLAVYLFVFPRQNRPAHASAIIVLGGDARQRVPLGLELAGAGVAPVLVVSDGAGSDWAPARALCAHPGGRSFKVVCFRPDPFSTRGEAREMKRMAAAQRWRSLLVVTSTYHVYRARMLFQRCLRGQHVRLYVEGTRSSRLSLPLNAAAETLKLVLAETVRRGC
ncbi:MAG: YdcF family protein [Gaiellaceae bacterium]